VRNPGEVTERAGDPWIRCAHEAVRRGFTLLAVGQAMPRDERARTQPAERSSDPAEIERGDPANERAAPADVGRIVAATTAAARAPERRGLLVGHGDDPWPRFVDALADGRIGDVDLSAGRAFDAWIEGELHAIAAASGVAYELVFAHAATLDFVQLAVDFGLAARARCRLAIHPTRGLWFALRGLVVLDEGVSSRGGRATAVGPARSSAPASAALCRAPGVPPCRGCPAPCVGPLASALGLMSARVEEGELAAAWLAVRDACPVGREHRYGDAQLGYHMGTSRAALLRRHARRRDA
jgi:methylmalonic aciduria homocystinuria type C protein